MRKYIVNSKQLKKQLIHLTLECLVHKVVALPHAFVYMYVCVRGCKLHLFIDSSAQCDLKKSIHVHMYVRVYEFE